MRNGSHGTVLQPFQGLGTDASGHDMEISIDRSKPHAVARVAGVLGAADAEALVEQIHPLVAQRGSKLIIGLDQVPSMSASSWSAPPAS